MTICSHSTRYYSIRQWWYQLVAVCMLMLQNAHLGEVSITIYPKHLKDICEKHNICVLE